VYVSNPARNRITEINPETGATRVIVDGHFSSPGGIAIGQSDGREALFVADFWGNQLAETASGATHRWERPTGVPSTANLAVSDKVYALSSIWPLGAVFVANRATNKTIKTVPLGAPYGMAFMPDGSLAVADYKNNALVRLAAGESRDKTTVTSALNGPVGVAAAGAKAVYVSEYGAGTVARIRLADGARTEIKAGLEKPEGLAVDRDGALIVAETGRQRVLRVDPATGATTVLASGIPMGLAGGPDVPAPFLMTGMAIGGDGSIYVSADVTNAVYRIRR
jgi:sugar lactone lactonase YvrE